MTIWKTKTCGDDQTDRTSCQVDLDTQPQPTFLFTCPAHSILSLATRFSDVVAENKRGWANVSQEILDSIPNPNPAILDAINITWVWSGTAPNRVLTVTVTGVTLNNPQKQNVQQKLDNRFGVGNVIAVFP